MDWLALLNIVLKYAPDAYERIRDAGMQEGGLTDEQRKETDARYARIVSDPLQQIPPTPLPTPGPVMGKWIEGPLPSDEELKQMGYLIGNNKWVSDTTSSPKAYAIAPAGSLIGGYQGNPAVWLGAIS